MFSPRNTLALFAVVTIAAIACACGGVSQGLTTPGALAPRAGATIATDDAVTIVFHRPLDKATLTGNVSVVQGGTGVPFRRKISDDGYVITIEPVFAWPQGELRITLTGGEQGIRYADGRGFDSINLTYFVGNR